MNPNDIEKPLCSVSSICNISPSNSSFSTLQYKINSISDLTKENSNLESNIFILVKELELLDNKLAHSKAERDILIGRNFVKMNTRASSSELEKTKGNLETLFVKSKLEYGKLSEEVLESEDMIQNYILACRACDEKKALIKKELEKIKSLSILSQIPTQIVNKQVTNALQRPIQLNSKKSHIRNAESLGK